MWLIIHDIMLSIKTTYTLCQKLENAVYKDFRHTTYRYH